MPSRLLFVGCNKIIDSVISLQFDKYLTPKPSKTIIYLGSREHGVRNDIDLIGLYTQYNIDTTNFSVVHDLDLLETYKNTRLINLFQPWILQQLLKLMAVDTCNDNKILIQYSDIILLKPYVYFENNIPVPFKFENMSHSAEYYKYVETFTGQPRQTEDCFVTDFMPFRKSDWQSLKQHIEQSYRTDWLTAITTQFKKDHPYPKGNIAFSEYELLGNWLLLNYPDLKTVQQYHYPLTAERTRFIKNKNFELSDFKKESFDSIAIKLYNDDIRLSLDDVDYIVKYFT